MTPDELADKAMDWADKAILAIAKSPSGRVRQTMAALFLEAFMEGHKMALKSLLEKVKEPSA